MKHDGCGVYDFVGGIDPMFTSLLVDMIDSWKELKAFFDIQM